MSYIGQTATITFGDRGLHTDDSQKRTPPDALIVARDIYLQNGLIEKSPGSRRWNSTAFSSGIIAFQEFFPNESTRRVVTVHRDGTVYRSPDAYSSSLVSASGAAPTTLNIEGSAQLVAGGNEAVNSNRKLFIFSGRSPIQVISGDASVRTNLGSTTGEAASDWSTNNYPTFGIVHRGRLWVFGNKNRPHSIYASSSSNHEDFSSGSVLTQTVYPGEGDGLYSGFVYKGKLFVLKKPKGVYVLVDDDASSSNWYFTRLNGDFGVASPNSAVPVLDDVLIANSTGSISSFAATFKLGDIEASDVLHNLRNESYMREVSSQGGLETRHGLYYEDKKQVFFTYQVSGPSRNNAMLVFDLSNKENPKVTWSFKDQANCFGLIRDVLNTQRPFYGSEDGYLYEMDVADRIVGDAVSAPGACTAALAGVGSGNLTAGSTVYKISYLTYNGGETAAGTASAPVVVADASVNGQISLTSIPTSTDQRVWARKIYRSRAGGAYALVAQISDNTTTTYVDNIAESNLGRAPLSSGTTQSYSAIFQVPHLDLGSEKNKIFDFLEVTFEPTGEFNLSVDVFIDGRYTQTKTFLLSNGESLDTFLLDTDYLSDRVTNSLRLPIRGRGRRISFVASNSDAYGNIKIQSMTVYYRLGNENQKEN